MKRYEKLWEAKNEKMKMLMSDPRFELGTSSV